MPSSYHGLTFKKGKDLLSSGAKITSGTFTDYLSSFNTPWKKGTVVTLRDSFSRIIEIHHDFRTIKGNSSYVFPVSVKAYTNGPIYIDLLIPYDDFPGKWEDDFPKLKQLCELDDNGKRLIIKDKAICESYESIAKCINSILFPYLIYNDSSSLWFLIREVDQSLIFPRASYYYLAIFILGSIVRYEPDLMLESSQMDSEIGWLLNRFIQAAERFFPQLKLWEQFNTTVYF